MIIFKKFAFYLSLAGIFLALFLLKILTAPQADRTVIQEPAVNPYANSIAASGIIEAANRNIAIGAPQSGLVYKLYVDVGEKVVKNQPLFAIDSRELQAKIDLQRANIEVSKASLKRLEDQLKRLQSVSDPRAISQDDIDTRKNDVRVAEAQLKASEAQLMETEDLIERLTVAAPKDGVILQNNIRLGEYYSTASGIPAMVLGNIDILQVRADIDEQNASRFNPDFPAVAYLKNNTKYRFPLKFDYVEPYMIPKKSLTGASSERVDTRVLQVVYSFEIPKDFKVFVGQQVDIFIGDNRLMESENQ